MQSINPRSVKKSNVIKLRMKHPLSLAYDQTAPPKGEPGRQGYSRETLLPLPLGEVARRSRDGEGGGLAVQISPVS